jgi:hypothetical protein
MKGLDRWLPAYILRKRTTPPAGERHLLIAVCDHYEPFHDADKKTALERVANWQSNHTAICREFRDCDGTPPRHTFFYPIEQWDTEVCPRIADLCHGTGGEAEIHLHHENDTPANLRETLLRGKENLASLGLLSKDATGETRYGFIHGNWALDHSHPEGRGCGVPEELPILRQTGCYADFTLPSAPSACQVRTINSLYYARENGRPRSHETGVRCAVGAPDNERDDELLCVQGPLGLNWRRRKFGIAPRIENSDLTGANPPTPLRLSLWEKLHIHVAGRPEWIFIKLHTHGAIERNSGALLGEPMRAFHRHLQERARTDKNFRYHYVSAREMVNILHAAEDGKSGDPSRFRDYRLKMATVR